MVAAASVATGKPLLRHSRCHGRRQTADSCSGSWPLKLPACFHRAHHNPLHDLLTAAAVTRKLPPDLVILVGAAGSAGPPADLAPRCTFVWRTGSLVYCTRPALRPTVCGGRWRPLAAGAAGASRDAATPGRRGRRSRPGSRPGYATQSVKGAALEAPGQGTVSKTVSCPALRCGGKWPEHGITRPGTRPPQHPPISFVSRFESWATLYRRRGIPPCRRGGVRPGPPHVPARQCRSESPATERASLSRSCYPPPHCHDEPLRQFQPGPSRAAGGPRGRPRLLAPVHRTPSLHRPVTSGSS
jgi:hypothetical protein